MGRKKKNDIDVVKETNPTSIISDAHEKTEVDHKELAKDIANIQGLLPGIITAMQNAYYQLTGEWPDFIFSGWDAELNEDEKNFLIETSPEKQEERHRRHRR